jgi:hypothetical protein
MEFLLKIAVITVLTAISLNAFYQWAVAPLMKSLDAIHNLLRHISGQLDQIIDKFTEQQGMNDKEG